MRRSAPSRSGFPVIRGSNPLGRREATKRRRTRAVRGLLFEPLEVRHLLATTIDDLHLLNDTGGSPSDLLTSDPQVAGTVQGDFAGDTSRCNSTIPATAMWTAIPTPTRPANRSPTTRAGTITR